ncbi:3D-(3,5/4)-trihydroxycyclohexane-1,2-dione acylhydrolase (decyclizing) [Phyllobacterium ifriqiyense]|uniref:3D-(3,5/4)-trihydroxycyclohexane-1,2-dione acylhydrolase (Decyclizing) n=1 Tax=Phyllobacterium ifriqiyense TaxID=314238 RepID=A0ABU0S7H7_9HYPH|nr:3D-(3,5/4)-trihydroxycyclohexane-1,2-dione acylhydrolase (decyclizing) [Phyllobacterium ifriqiyense]MDQ0996695.1 3D-(3,5/4)-trihydroxycyclohexane-1,2-dione acylhydrolase (decyclizing) [Phyllobacterium ifriqiyense]
MSNTVRLTMAQALTRFLAAQMTTIDGKEMPIFAGVWAIFGHGNVAGIGEALYQVRDELPTYRAHNEQAMAHAAIAFAKASFRQRMMAVTSSVGPGATNMVTAAALAHVNRLPLLLLPGDVFANRIPDPVLQQVESFADGTISANDCFKPVSRYFDRITRPEQIIPALARAMTVLTDPAECGPVTLALCQDVQAEAYDYPESFFDKRVWSLRRPRPDRNELSAAVAALQSAKKPLVIAGGGVIFSQASKELADFVEAAGIPVCETQGGKSSLPDSHPLNMAAVGVTGTSAANRLAQEADVIIAVGTRLQDFTTGSWSLFQNSAKTFIGLNVQTFDAAKHRALPLVADAKEGLLELTAALQGYKAPASWTENAKSGKAEWQKAAAKVTSPTNASLPSDAQVIGAVQRTFGAEATVLHAAGGLPGEMHKLWQAGAPGSYHAEYGFSCMGYEIAGGLGAKMAKPDDEVVVMIGDGSYLMLNSELATSVMLGQRITVVLLDNRGYGCINRLQMGTGGANFNNLLKDSKHEVLPDIDFAAHARSLGAISEKVASIAELETALARAKDNDRTTVIVIDTDPLISTEEGGTWWDVAVPEVSQRSQVTAARKEYEQKLKLQRVGD